MSAVLRAVKGMGGQTHTENQARLTETSGISARKKTHGELETAMGQATDENILDAGTVFAKEMRLEKIGRFSRLT